MTYLVEPTNRIFLFDVARGQMEYFQTAILEMLKDRLVQSNKYAPCLKRLTSVPHVVVFCNEDPSVTNLTANRYNIIDLST